MQEVGGRCLRMLVAGGLVGGASGCVAGVMGEVHSAAEVRLDVHWDVWWGQVCCASGCGQQGQDSRALGGGGLAGGASRCTRGDLVEGASECSLWESGEQCNGRRGSGLRSFVLFGSGGRCFGMPAVVVRWEVHRAVGCSVRQGVHWAVGGSGGRCIRICRWGVWWEVLPDARGRS
jgi:hypothetical protein